MFRRVVDRGRGLADDTQKKLAGPSRSMKRERCSSAASIWRFSIGGGNLQAPKPRGLSRSG